MVVTIVVTNYVPHASISAVAVVGDWNGDDVKLRPCDVGTEIANGTDAIVTAMDQDSHMNVGRRVSPRY
jgi:hypothetical protein